MSLHRIVIRCAAVVLVGTLLISACKKKEDQATESTSPPPDAPPSNYTPPTPVLKVESVSPALTLPRMNFSGINFIIVPPGSFTMGSPVDEPGRGLRVSESQQRRTIDKPFGLSECEITAGDYYSVMDPAKCPNEPEKSLPMSGITWNEAMEFCRRLSRQNSSGKSFRLPTEIEWEYCCRAGDHPEMYAIWKGGGSSLSEAIQAFTAVNRKDKHKLKSGAMASFSYKENSQAPQKVASYPANAWGFHDMHGNVWEWCASAPDMLPPKLNERPIRGGSYLSGEAECRAAQRAWQNQDTRIDAIGFRVLLENP